jgi:trimeric autotransporter adhesin
VGWTSRCSGATGAAAWRTHLGRSHTWADAAGSANMGRASCSAIFDAGASASRAARSAARDSVGSAASATGSAELGCDSRAACSGLGCAAGRRAARSGTAAGAASATAATGRAAATCADLGVAPRRGSCSGIAGTFVGRIAAGCSSARLGIDRLGIALGQRSAGSATRAFVERAGSGLFVGRAQNPGARSSPRPVVGGAFEHARAAAGLVGPTVSPAATARGRVGSPCRTAAPAIAARFSHLTGARSRGRRSASRAGGAGRVASSRPTTLAAACPGAAR